MLQKIIKLSAIFFFALSNCGEEKKETLEGQEQLGTWSFSKMSCDGTPVTLNNFSETIYISPNGFNTITTGNGCSIYQNNGQYIIDGFNMQLGGGSYSCNPNQCVFNYSITVYGRTVDIDPINCPDELGSPPPVQMAPAVTFQSSTSFTISESNSGTTCTVEYKKISSDYNLPEVEPEIEAPPPEPGDNPPYTRVTFTGEPGNWVGQGTTHEFTLESGTWTLPTVYPKMAYVRYFDSGDEGSWSFFFAGADGNKLTTGHYSNATRAPYHDAGTPGISISGDGRACSSSGNFHVIEIEYDEDTPTKFAINFEMFCDNKPEKLTGSIRYNSLYP